MSGRIIRPPVIEWDLVTIAEYIGQRNVDAGLRFFDAAEDAFQRLSSMPLMGGSWDSPNPRLSGIRWWPIRGFENYIVFYRALSDGIALVRVLHGGRSIEKLLGG
jgi:toxin ParE1/3/4